VTIPIWVATVLLVTFVSTATALIKYVVTRLEEHERRLGDLEHNPRSK
jgi:hypothetical protein